MSKYKLNLGYDSGYVNVGEDEIIDLVEDWGYTEERAANVMADPILQIEILTEWLFETIDVWVEPIEE